MFDLRNVSRIHDPNDVFGILCDHLGRSWRLKQHVHDCDKAIKLSIVVLLAHQRNADIEINDKLTVLARSGP